MQGGADEGVRLRSAVNAANCSRDKKWEEFVTPPIDTLEVKKEIVMTPRLDATLYSARHAFALTLATPIAWICLDSSVAACQSRKHNRVVEGAAQVVSLQQVLKTTALDWYFSLWSFCAEEEFYLLTLPPLFWSVEYRYARQLTFVVCIGLLWGNLLKDVFRLPRPANVDARVQVPNAANQVDSTACRDFGFPSTHAMNSVTNSLYTALYFGGMSNVWSIGCVAIWISSISFARLYLGVHSPMDIKGGFVLGLVVVCIAWVACPWFDYWLLSTPNSVTLLFCALVVILVLHPQPRPQTPTFMQNCVCSGLVWGCAAGFCTEAARVTAAESKSPESISLGLHIGRAILGFTILLVVRQITKEILTSAFRLVGLESNPGKPVPRKDVGESAAQQIKGWDLAAAALVKSFVYATLAWTITCGCPMFFDIVLGLPCKTVL